MASKKRDAAIDRKLAEWWGSLPGHSISDGWHLAVRTRTRELCRKVWTAAQRDAKKTPSKKKTQQGVSRR